MANVQGKISLKVIKALAEANNGGFKRIDNVDCDGEKGFTLVFAWDDEDESDAFVELLEDLLESTCLNAFNAEDTTPVRLLGCAHDHEDGVLCSYLRLDAEVK